MRPICLLALLLLPMLTACESTKSWTDNLDWFSSSPTDSKSTPLNVHTSSGCPPVTAPKAVAEQSIGGTAPLDLQAMVQIAVVESKCDAKDSAVRQTVALKIDATKGPALKLNKLQVPFFAAVTSPTGAVLAKKMYQTTFSFDGELTATEELAVVFNLTPTQAATATVYVGLGIDPADLQVGQ